MGLGAPIASSFFRIPFQAILRLLARVMRIRKMGYKTSNLKWIVTCLSSSGINSADSHRWPPRRNFKKRNLLINSFEMKKLHVFSFNFSNFAALPFLLCSCSRAEHRRIFNVAAIWASAKRRAFFSSIQRGIVQPGVQQTCTARFSTGEFRNRKKQLML